MRKTTRLGKMVISEILSCTLYCLKFILFWMEIVMIETKHLRCSWLAKLLLISLIIWKNRIINCFHIYEWEFLSIAQALWTFITNLMNRSCMLSHMKISNMLCWFFTLCGIDVIFKVVLEFFFSHSLTWCL